MTKGGVQRITQQDKFSGVCSYGLVLLGIVCRISLMRLPVFYLAQKRRLTSSNSTVAIR